MKFLNLNDFLGQFLGKKIHIYCIVGISDFNLTPAAI